MAAEYAELGDNNTVPVESGGTGETTVQGVVDAFGIFLAISAAAAYAPEGSYAVGDYCTQGGKLHKCNTAIDSGEIWTAEHWTETTVAAELAEVMASLSNKVACAGEPVPLGTNILTLAPGRYSVDQVPNTEMANKMNLPVTAWHYEIDVIAAANATGLVSNYKVIIVYPSSNVVLPYINIMNYEGKWTGWTQISTATPPQVRNLTLQSGFTADEGGCTFFKLQENIVFLDGGVAGTLPAEKLTQIGTLPTGFYPISDKRRDAVTTTGTAYIEIHTDGTVWIYPFTASIRCWFSTSFEAALGGGT